MKNKIISMPPVGMRIVKSAIGVFLGFIICLLRDGSKTSSIYIALSVIWCMQPYYKSAKAMAFQRTIGTLIGAFYGLIVILLEYYVISSEFLRYTVISIFIIPVIYTTLLVNKRNASYFSCVVFLSIVVVHIIDDNPYLFVFDRTFDTMIGIFLALIINTIRIPRNKQKDILFVSGVDDVIVNKNYFLSDYSKFQLNRMLSSGMKFTFATIRTPASLISLLQGVDISLPVIAMDGAALFDITQKRYLKIYEIPYIDVKSIEKFISERGFHYFTNVIIEDLLVIYYGSFKNEIEERVYNKLRVSPYRNYIRKTLVEDQGAVYILVIDEKEKIDNLYSDLASVNYTQKFKVLKNDSEEYKGYTYLRIYSKKATKENMIDYIKEITRTNKVITFGSIQDKYDIIIKDNNNKMVKELELKYEPYFWKKNNG